MKPASCQAVLTHTPARPECHVPCSSVCLPVKARPALLVVGGAPIAPAEHEQAERSVGLQSLQKVHQRWLPQHCIWKLCSLININKSWMFATSSLESFRQIRRPAAYQLDITAANSNVVLLNCRDFVFHLDVSRCCPPFHSTAIEKVALC